MRCDPCVMPLPLAVPRLCAASHVSVYVDFMVAISLLGGQALKSPRISRCSASDVSQCSSSEISVTRLPEEVSRCVDVRLIVRPLTEIVASAALRSAARRWLAVAMNGYFDKMRLPLPIAHPAWFTNTLYQVRPVAFCSRL